MTKLDVHKLTLDLGRYLHRAASGETIVVTEGGRALVELRPPSPEAEGPMPRRPIGLARGLVALDERFFEPLPDSLLDAFEGSVDRARDEET